MADPQIDRLNSMISTAKAENAAAQSDILAKRIKVIYDKLQKDPNYEPSDEEFKLWQDFRYQTLKEKVESNPDYEPSEKELNFVQQYKAANQPEKIAEQSPFKNPLDELGTRAYLQLVKTVPEAANKYLINRFGKDNVYTDSSGTTYVRPKGEENFFAVNPAKADTGNIFSNIAQTPDIAGEIGQAIPDLGRFIATTAGGIAGAAAGGPFGAAVGSASGEIAGDVLAAGAAAAGGASGEDIRQSAGGTLGRATLAGVLAPLAELAGPTVAAIGKKLRIGGNVGREISAMKGQVESQALSDQILGGIEGAKNLGDVVKNAVVSTKNSILANAENLFNQADQAFGESLQKGTFAFADTTKAIQQLRTKLDAFVDDGLIPKDEAINTFNAITNQLNNVKRNVLNGKLPSSDLAKTRFTQTVEKLPEDGRMAFNMQDIGNNLGFDPKQVTALDLRKTSNVIQELYGNTGNKRLQSLLADFRQGVDGALGGVSTAFKESEEMLKEVYLRSGGNIEDFISKGAESLGSPKVSSDFLNSIVTPKGAKDFVNYKKAFQARGERFRVIPKQFLGLNEGTDPKLFADALYKATPDEATRLRSIMDASGFSSDFSQSLKSDILNRTTTLKSSQRAVKQGVPEDVLANAKARTPKEVMELEATTGQKARLGGVKEQFLNPSEMSSQLEPIVSGKGLADYFKQGKGKTVEALLGEEGTVFKQTANQLESAQKAAGMATRLTDTNKFQTGETLSATPRILETVGKGLSSIPGGKILSELASGTINPIQRGVGNIMDTALGRMIPTQAVTSLAPALLGSLQYGTNVTPPSDEFLQNILRARGTRFVNGR